MEDENLPAAKKDVWLMRRELEIRMEQLEEQMTRFCTKLSEQIRDIHTELKAFPQRDKRD
jgi:hypothetical protein